MLTLALPPARSESAVDVLTTALADPGVTPGPWEAVESWVVAPQVPPIESRFVHECLEPSYHQLGGSYEHYGGDLIGESMQSADARLIAAMRNQLPAILAELQQLRARVGGYR